MIYRLLPDFLWVITKAINQVPYLGNVTAIAMVEIIIVLLLCFSVVDPGGAKGTPGL